MKPNQYLNLVGATCGSLFTFLHLAHGDSGYIWTRLSNAPNQPWQAVASSADGSKLVAVAYGGGIYTSTNSGTTWLSNNVPVKNWYSVASSADGAKLAAVTSGGAAEMWNSSDSGKTWNLTSAPRGSLQNYMSITSSADGTKLAAAGASLPTRYIYTSADSGATWHATSAPNLSWYSVASSADGTKLVAAAWNNTLIYTSTDSGANWIPHTVPNNYWYSVSSSADGSKLVAVVNGGGVFTSSNAGATWVSNSVPSKTWYSVASSSDGSIVVAVGINAIYSTTNGGQTWISNTVAVPLWLSVASSTNGSRLFAAAASGPNTGLLYVGTLPTPAAPSLSIAASGSNFKLAWPSSAAGFQLQQNLDLITMTWAEVTNTVLITNGLNQVTVSPTNSRAFYRLKGQ